ncbi:MAG: Flp family type IVb pilin [Actinobacteria bacterium]|nr:Flp family type IVb pilin [Actinomycetota bacterium]
MRTAPRGFVTNERGATMVEDGIMVALIAVIAILAVAALGLDVFTAFDLTMEQRSAPLISDW